jgi:hypothetical protein
MATATVDTRQQLETAKALDNGRELMYPGDDWLAEPEVYYNPHSLNIRFKVYTDPKADPRRPLETRWFLPEKFVGGKYVAYTRLQREAVRRVLGQNADRWKGDTESRTRVCRKPSCRFASRNYDAFEDHLTYTEHGFDRGPVGPIGAPTQF